MNDTPPERFSIPSTEPEPEMALPAVRGGSAVVERPLDVARATAASQARRASRPTLKLNLEVLLYGLVSVLAVVTRFWDLSYRALHHDESLHAYFSWLFYAGDGYIHDPLMHGPTLFHADALAYLLFGDNDYTTRVWPALLGVILVLMPALLRGPQLLGRWGALACSTLLLFSPSILYYTRFIRHDPFVLVMTLAIVISALRYLERPERRWVVSVGVMSGLLFATMEVSFIIAFVLVTFVVGVVTWQLSRTAFAIVIATGIGMLAVWKAMPALGAPALPGIPWEDPTSANVREFAFQFVVHPIFLASLGVFLLGAVGVLTAVDRARHREAGGTWLDSVLASQPPGTTSYALLHLIRDRSSLWIAVGLGLALFVVFYTTMFTNMFGLASGTVGALGYWLGQQNVQRADQPWFYYLIVLVQYEFIAVLMLPVGIVLTARRLIPAVLARRPVGRRTYLRGLALYWALVNLAIFSWAGEKMPWLTVHMVLPLSILAASVIGSGIEQVERAVSQGRLRAPTLWAAVVGIPLLVGAWFLTWAWGTAGPWAQRDTDLTRTLRDVVAENPIILYLPVLALLGLIGYVIWKAGGRTALPLVGVVLVVMTLLAQIHVSFRLTYREGDVPRDMLVYVQSSPDVTRAVEEIGLLSRELTGGKDMPIYYDSGTSWPFQWYLRDYSGRRYFGDNLSEAPDAPIVLISNENLSAENRQMLEGYTATEYAMRWWFPEDETYRRFAIAPELNKVERQNYQTDEEGPYGLTDVAESVWRSLWALREPEQQARMFRLVAYREVWAPIGSYNFQVYVRNDLLQTWNDIRY